MSVLTTTPLKSAPSAATSVSIIAGSLWAFGSWVEIITSTAAPIAIAGVEITDGSYSDFFWELDIGTGAAGAEVSVGTLRLYLYNSGVGSGPTGILLPLPLGGIGSGVRVAVRARSANGSGPAKVALNYYESLDSDQVTTSSHVLTSSPSGSGTASLTPNASAWVNSAWVELIASASADLGLLGIVHGSPGTAAANGTEYDLGTGAAGSETVITTLREATLEARLILTWLPGVYPITAGTRLAVRMRKSSTSTTAHPIAVLYYTGVSSAPPSITATGSVTIDAPALDGTGAVAAFFAHTTQLAAEVLDVIPNAPLAATQLAAELVRALAGNEARVTQLCCELIILPLVPGGCATDFPIDDPPATPSCRVDFPT